MVLRYAMLEIVLFYFFSTMKKRLKFFLRENHEVLINTW